MIESEEEYMDVSEQLIQIENEIEHHQMIYNNPKRFNITPGSFTYVRLERKLSQLRSQKYLIIDAMKEYDSLGPE